MKEVSKNQGTKQPKKHQEYEVRHNRGGAFDDEILVRYRLGTLPAEEAERLDELSIADDGLAARLRAIENDLVDAYLRDELTREDLEQFKSFYLSSPKRRKKVEFAVALMLVCGAIHTSAQLSEADTRRGSHGKCCRTILEETPRTSSE